MFNIRGVIMIKRIQQIFISQFIFCVSKKNLSSAHKICIAIENNCDKQEIENFYNTLGSYLTLNSIQEINETTIVGDGDLNQFFFNEFNFAIKNTKPKYFRLLKDISKSCLLLNEYNDLKKEIRKLLHSFRDCLVKKIDTSTSLQELNNLELFLKFFNESQQYILRNYLSKKKDHVYYSYLSEKLKNNYISPKLFRVYMLYIQLVQDEILKENLLNNLKQNTKMFTSQLEQLRSNISLHEKSTLVTF